jgi:hypothetical protein
MTSSKTDVETNVPKTTKLSQGTDEATLMTPTTTYAATNAPKTTKPVKSILSTHEATPMTSTTTDAEINAPKATKPSESILSTLSSRYVSKISESSTQSTTPGQINIEKEHENYIKALNIEQTTRPMTTTRSTPKIGGFNSGSNHFFLFDMDFPNFSFKRR